MIICSCDAAEDTCSVAVYSLNATASVEELVNLRSADLDSVEVAYCEVADVGAMAAGVGSNLGPTPDVSASMTSGVVLDDA